MSRAASSSSSDTKTFWRRPRLPSQPNLTGPNRYEGRPVIRVAAAQVPQRKMSTSPQQQSSDEDDEELRSFLTIRDPAPRHSRRRDDSPSSPASSYSSSRLSPWSTPTSPRWSGSTTPPGSSSLEGHSPGLSTSLSSSPFSEASIILSQKNGHGESGLSKNVSLASGSTLNLPDPPPPCNLWSGCKCPELLYKGPKGGDVSTQIADFWKYRRSSDASAESEARKQRDGGPRGAAGRRSSYHALEPGSDDSSTDVSKGARPKLPLQRPTSPSMLSPEKGSADCDTLRKGICGHCKLMPSLLPLECCEEDVKARADMGEPLATLGLKKGLNWPCTLQQPPQRCLDCLYSVPLSSGAQWVQASCGKFPWNRRRGSVGALVHLFC